MHSWWVGGEGDDATCLTSLANSI